MARAGKLVGWQGWEKVANEVMSVGRLLSALVWLHVSWLLFQVSLMSQARSADMVLLLFSLVCEDAEGERMFLYCSTSIGDGWDTVYCTGGKCQRDCRVAQQLRLSVSTEFMMHASNRSVSIFLMGVELG